MTTLFNQRTFGGRLALCLLALSAVLFEAREARAQWTAPNAQGHINSTNTGNVGVGTATPNARFVIASGNFGMGTNNISPWTAQTSVIESLDTSIFFGLDTDLGLNSNAYHFNGWKYRTDDAASNIHLYKGSIYFRTAGAGATGAPLTWTNSMLINSSGNVGIGTTSPGKALVVQNDAANNHLSIIRPTTNAAMLNIGIDNTGPFFESVSPNKPISFYTHNGTAIAERVRINKDGNVGIGTTAPATALHVVGDVTVTGNISAKYQDVAEWVPSAQKLSAGTVVVLDPERNNHVLASTAAYDTAVAGVVSAQPGLSLGEAGADKALIATTGRVKVKVDATRAPIKIGDLLVTSDVAGVAMKSEPVTLGGRRMHAPGTIIGKALEPLAGGKGEILVLLSLQ